MTTEHRPLPLSYLTEWKIVPMLDGGGLRVLAAHPPDPQVMDDLRWLYRVEPRVELISAEELDTALTRLEHGDGLGAELVDTLEAGAAGGGEDAGEANLAARVQEAPVIRLVNALLRDALEARASDVHLESGRTGLEVRFRIDGILVEAPAPPSNLAAAVLGRLKVMAEMDVAERRRPQDGRVRLRVDGRSVDVRVSTLPTLHGESLVMRILEAGTGQHDLGILGMGPDVLERWCSLLARPNGVILATGPTGSGKTTTLYGSLERIRTGREKVVTVEDPVEYALRGVAQVPVNRKAGVSFATALRSILRQDPDVILVGEMRDAETAEICLQAALTGHLVLSTLHTNDAPGALVRLMDLEVEPYLVASTVEGVLAQRLVRAICSHCAEEYTPPAPIAAEMEGAGFGPAPVRRGRGCPACQGTGYRGRTGIYELLAVDEEVRAETLRRRGAEQIRQGAIARGMRSLRQDGWRRVAEGATTPDEVLRVTSA